MQFYKKIHMSDILLTLLFYILVKRVSSGYSNIVLTNNEDVSGTPVDSFVVRDEVKIRHEFERRVRDLEIVHTNPNEDPYKYGTYYNPPKSDWFEIWEQRNKHREEQKKREREEEEERRKRIAMTEELQNRVATNKIIAGVAVTLTIIGVTICICIRVQYDAKQRSRRNIQADNNRMAGTAQRYNRTRESAPVEDRTLIPLRGNVETSSNDHRNDQEELPSAPIGFLPNFHGSSNNSRSHNLPTANLHDHSNSSSNHDLPPSYEEAVVGLKPTAPPAHNGDMPSSKI